MDFHLFPLILLSISNFVKPWGGKDFDPLLPAPFSINFAEIFTFIITYPSLLLHLRQLKDHLSAVRDGLFRSHGLATIFFTEA